jgi:hypothetical protein
VRAQKFMFKWILIALLLTACGANAQTLSSNETEVPPASNKLDAATALLWIESEQSGDRALYSNQLDVAVRAAAAMKLKAAVPFLISIYDAPTGFDAARNTAALAVFDIDPDYSLDFARSIMRDERLTKDESWMTAVPAAARVLAERGDAAGRAFLLQGFRGFLDDLGDLRIRNVHFALNVEQLRDPEAIKAIRAFRDDYPNPRVREFIDGAIEQIELNTEPAKKLIAIVEQSDRPEKTRRRAVVALKNAGNADAASRLAKLASDLEAKGAASETAPEQLLEARRRFDGLVRAGFPSFVKLLRTTAESIDRRVNGSSTQPSTRSSTQPATRPTTRRKSTTQGDLGEVPEGAQPLVAETITAQTSERLPERWATCFSLDGRIEGLRLRISKEQPIDEAKRLKPGNLVLLKSTGNEVDWIHGYDPKPGEMVQNVYLFQRTLEMPNDKWKHRAVSLWKYGREYTAAIPNRSREGQSVPDSRMLKAVENLEPGALVEARIEKLGGMQIFSYLAPFRPLMWATLISVNGDEIVLDLARHRVKCKLPPAEETPDPEVFGMTLAKSQPGTRVRVSFDNDRQPLVVRELRTTGYVATRPTNDSALFTSGRGTFQVAKLSARPPTGLIGITGTDTEALRMQNGLRKILDNAELREKWIPADKVDALRQLRTQEYGPYSEEHESLNQLLGQWIDSTLSERDRTLIEQKMFTTLHSVSQRADAYDADRVARVRKVLSPEQWEVVQDIGRSRPRPYMRDARRPRPTTQTSATQTSAPSSAPTP